MREDWLPADNYWSWWWVCVFHYTIWYFPKGKKIFKDIMCVLNMPCSFQILGLFVFLKTCWFWWQPGRNKWSKWLLGQQKQPSHCPLWLMVIAGMEEDSLVWPTVTLFLMRNFPKKETSVFSPLERWCLMLSDVMLSYVISCELKAV